MSKPQKNLWLTEREKPLKIGGAEFDKRGAEMKLWGRNQENKYNRFIRERVRKAREERGMSQEKLGEAIHRSRLTMNRLESGETEINAVDLMGIAYTLEKPISFFYPDFVVVRGVNAEELTDKEKELIHFFRQMQDEAIENILLDQAKKFAEIAIQTQIEEDRREAEEAPARLREEKSKKAKN